MMPDYVTVSVESALAIAKNHDKDIVVILSVDNAHDLVHITTFGKSAEDKILAAKIGELFSLRFNLDDAKRQTFEDFRYVDSAKAKEMIDTLSAKVKDLEEKLDKCKEDRGYDY